ncbi:hypothetical protein [Achromobacter sp.]|uniref:hypothetical protein n=1 Tax=Achromobacter sp. TaxID=134375 RepID=UPI003CFFEF03
MTTPDSSRQELVDLERRHARLARELNDLRHASQRSRRAMRCLLALALLLSGGASLWLLVSLCQMVAQGFVVECARMSSIDCRRVGDTEGAYWLALFVRIFMLALAGSASVFAALMLRAMLKPAHDVGAMRARLQRLEALIAQTRQACADSGE